MILTGPCRIISSTEMCAVHALPIREVTLSARVWRVSVYVRFLETGYVCTASLLPGVYVVCEHNLRVLGMGVVVHWNLIELLESIHGVYHHLF